MRVFVAVQRADVEHDTESSVESEVSRLLRSLRADLLSVRSDFVTRFKSAPPENRAEILESCLLARLDAFARAYWNVIPYADGEAAYERILDKALTDEIEPVYREYRASVPDANIDERIRNALTARRDYYIAEAIKARISVEQSEQADTDTCSREPFPTTSVASSDAAPLTWHDVTLSLITELTAETIVRGQRRNWNFAELGFADKRSNKSGPPKPNAAWRMLCQFAERGGIIQKPTNWDEQKAQLWSKVEKRAQEIRKALRLKLAIKGDPLPSTGAGYRTAFIITCSPSYRASNFRPKNSN